MGKAIRFLTSPFCLIFCCGFLFAVEIYLDQENRYEIQLFGSLANDVKKEPEGIGIKQQNIDSIFVSATNLTHELIQSRMNRFTDLQDKGSFKAFLQPVAYDLMTGNGACGSNSYVLARLLMQLGFNVRIAQMGFYNNEGRHIITEAWNGEKWIVLDALYNAYFRMPNGKLASFSEVSGNWNYYKSQVPSNYNMQYDFYTVRYTNWNKIPVILPFIRKILELVIGKEKTFNICLRKYYIKKYQLLLRINSGLLVLFFFFALKSLFSRSLVPDAFAKGKSV